MIEMTERKPTVVPPALAEWRCSKCRRILAKVSLGPGSAVEVKCSSCNTFSYRSVDGKI